MNYILWDVDGTLVFNGKDAGNLYHQAVEIVAGRSFGNQLPNMHGKTDGRVITETLEAHGLDAGLHGAASAQLDELSRLRHEAGSHRQLCPGVHEALADSAAAGWTNALLTGNSSTRSGFKLTGAGLAHDTFAWDNSYFGNITPVRSDLTVQARAELDGALVIIGDTPRDDDAAKIAGIPFIAVATGAFTADELRETGAILVIDDLESGRAALAETLSTLAR